MPRLRLVLIVGTFALHAAALVAQQAQTLRTLASFRGDSIKEFSVSPSGRFVLLGTKTNLRMYDPGARQSWDLADGGAQNLAWSPTGDRVAWNRTGDDYVWVMPVNARTGRARGPAQRLTIGRSTMASFSADGRWVAVAEFDSFPRLMRLSIVPATGGPERILARNLSFEGITWSADGRTIYLDGGIWGTDIDGLLRVRVGGGAPELMPTAPRDGFMIGATADGRYLVLERAGILEAVGVGDSATIVDTAGRVVGRVPLPAGRVLGFPGVLGDTALAWITVTGHSVLEMRSLNGGSATRLPLIGESDDVPLWSPDGSRIAFQVHESGGASLAVMNADGTRPQVYRESGLQAGVWAVLWSPDSRLVAFRSRHGLSLLDVAAGTIRTVLDDDSTGLFRWRADGQAILVRSRRSPGAGIFEVTLSGQNRQLLDWPVPSPNPLWSFVGDTSIFIRFDTAAVVRPLGGGSARRLSGAPVGSTLAWAVTSHDLQRVAGQLAFPGTGRSASSQIEVFSLVTGARTVLDLPFSWMTDQYPWGASYPPVFLPGDSAVLIFGRHNGDADIKLYRVPLNGDAPIALADVGPTRLTGGALAASASPDGRQVVYSVQPEEATQSLVLIDLRGAIPQSSARAPRR